MDNQEFILKFIENPEKYYLEDDNRINIGSNPSIKLNDIVFYKIDRITFEDKAPRKEALENVLSAMRIEGVNFLYLIIGDAKGVTFYYGISRDLIQNIHLPHDIKCLGEMVLKPGLESNFRGSKISSLTDDDELKIIKKISNMEYIANLDGVPGINGDNENYQGVDRMVDMMLGDDFAFLVTAKSMPLKVIRSFENNIYKFYDSLAPYSKKNIQSGENKGTTEVDTTTNGRNISDSEGQQTSITKNHGKSHSENRSVSTTYRDDETRSEGTSITNNEGVYSDGQSNSKTHTKGESASRTVGVNETKGTSKNISYEFTNKEAQEWLKYIDEVLLKRLDYGRGKGIYIATITLFTKKEANMIKLKNTVTSLFSGDAGNKVPLRKIESNDRSQRSVVLRNFQIPIASFMHNLTVNEIYTRTVLSQYVTETRAYLGNWFSVNELSVIAGLPQKEIAGLALREEVEFGLNCCNVIPESSKLELGNLVQSGNQLPIKVSLDCRELNKHIFVAGVTGSGKTTTCQKILLNSHLPFLVIEPAKTEYRILTQNFDDVLIFTLGRDKVAPFRLNPFEFYPHESITSHVDMIMASIKSAFDMEAAIPQIIEKSIYECYKDCGWDILDDTNKYYTPEAIENGAYAFPTLEELLAKTEEVVKTQGFDMRLQNDYIGSIRARLQGLIVGAKGLMLNTKRSVDFRNLVHKRVILELEEIRSGAEKSLIMGFVVSNLMEAIRAEYYRNPKFKHITLIEEAHRLLAKFEPGDSLSKKYGIEMFADMLAEVRKYGEALIIADQIPSKLTPEVLKNTNTKIVHKIFAQDDKEVIGNTMALTNEQKEFLSFLDIGRVVVFSQGWDSSMQVQVLRETDTISDEIIDETVIRDNIIRYYCENFNTGIYPTLKYSDSIPSKECFIKHLKYRNDFVKLLSCYQHMLKHLKATKEFQDTLLKLEDIVKISQQAKYIRDMVYYQDVKDEKYNVLCSLLLEIKNGNFDATSYSEKLSYGRRMK